MKNKLGINNPNFKNGFRCNGKRLGFYNSWQCMKSRCLNKNNPKYKNYGGRGIGICSEWLLIENFAKWALENGWQEGYSIDRIDNNGDYCPENCRWISMSENSRKKRTTKLTQVEADEIRKRRNENWHDLANEYGCSLGNIWYIMNNFIHVPEGECTRKIKAYKYKK